MASLTIPASFLPATRPSSINRRPSASAKPITTICSQKKAAPTRSSNQLECKEKETVNSRRGMILAAAAAMWAFRSPPEMAAVAAEVEEPKPGTTEAKKKYYPVCVTMPTARICHK